MRVVVTGGAGFVGSAVCRYLVGEVGATVLNVDRLGYVASQTSLEAISGSPRYTFRRADIRNGAHIGALLEAFEPGSIVHLAAETHGDRSTAASEDLVESNIVGTSRLFEAVHGYWAALPATAKADFRFLHASTAEVYGSLGPVGRFAETSPYAPSSPFAATKAASDHLVLAWQRSYGLPALISHCANTYGPRQFPERLVPLTIVNAIQGSPLSVCGDGDDVRDWLHVEDCARAIHALLRSGRPGEVYNIGGRSERTNVEVVHRIADLVEEFRPGSRGRTATVTFDGDRPGHDRRQAVDPAKIETETGWRAEIGFEAGLRKTVRWYLENEQWWGPFRAANSGGEWFGALTRERVA